MAFRTNTKQLFSKAESAFGTFANPIDHTITGISATIGTPVKQNVRLMDVEFSIDPESESTTFLTGTAAQSYDLIGKKPGTLSYSMLIAPGEFIKDTLDAANSHIFEGASYWNSVGCNVEEIKDPLVSKVLYTYPMKYIVYPTVDAWEKSLSFTGVVKNTSNGKGYGQDFYGVMSNGVISTAGVGKPVSLKFDAKGGTGDDTYDIAAGATGMDKIVFDPANIIKTVANKYLDATITITENSGIAPKTITVCTNTFELNMGNEMKEMECQGTASGILGQTIVNAKPTMKFNPFLTSKSDFDWFKGLVNETTYTIEIKFNDKNTADNSAYVPMEIFVPNAQMKSNKMTDDGGIMRVDVEWTLLGNWEKVLPTITYQLDADGTDAPWVPATGPLATRSWEMPFFLIFTEEYFKDL